MNTMNKPIISDLFSGQGLIYTVGKLNEVPVKGLQEQDVSKLYQMPPQILVQIFFGLSYLIKFLFYFWQVSRVP